jgi:predicted kinase
MSERRIYGLNECNQVAAASPQPTHRPMLICTVGLPLSGKSTWARQQGIPIVCPDEIRRALHGERYAPLAEPMVWAMATLMVRALFGAGHERVILDACNNTRKRRDPWTKEFNAVFKVIGTPAETCLERALGHRDHYIVPIIGRMASEFEPLGEGEEQWPL